jgi:uncharacterized oligopeptide transporter (OPT) family protein
VLSCVILRVQFDVSIGNTIVGIILAFIFSFIGVQATGTLGINPVGSIGKCSQLVAQTTNLLAGSLAGQAASHSVDMTGDLKIGHLMSATPKGQFWAQLFGTVFGIVPLTALFVIYTKAYPCILDDNIQPCPFALPAVMAWKAVAIAMTDPSDPIPKSSGNSLLFSYAGIAAIVLALVAVVSVVIRTRLPTKYQPYMPNWVAIGLAFTFPNPDIGFALVCGAVCAFLVKKYKPQVWDMFGYPFAAGLSAGEACSGLLKAGLVIAGVGGSTKGSQVGCPFGDC